MQPKNDLHPDTVIKLLRYDAVTGDLIWKPRQISDFTGDRANREYKRWNARYAGSIAGNINSGYVSIKIQGRKYKAHRLVAVITTGQWPVDRIDHINRKRADNSAANLRPINITGNSRNKNIYKTNKTGCSGVSFDPRISKYQVKISNTHIGTFDDFDAAVAARRAAEIEHGYHPTHGR